MSPGVAHFYLEQYHTPDKSADLALATDFGQKMIDCYGEIFSEAVAANPQPPTEEEKQKQLAYHTLYFFQVLTLDRGTTSGLLAHSHNDVGTLGSLPTHVNGDLLRQWVPQMPQPQDQLLSKIIEVFSGPSPWEVNAEAKVKIAGKMREHYQRFPEALSLQASGNVIPQVVTHHR